MSSFDSFSLWHTIARARQWPMLQYTRPGSRVVVPSFSCVSNSIEPWRYIRNASEQHRDLIESMFNSGELRWLLILPRSECGKRDIGTGVVLERVVEGCDFLAKISLEIEGKEPQELWIHSGGLKRTDEQCGLDIIKLWPIFPVMIEPCEHAPYRIVGRS